MFCSCTLIYLFVKSLSWSLDMAQKYLFIAILCVKMSRVNKAYIPNLVEINNIL